MSTTARARSRMAATTHAPTSALARIEAGRMLRSSAPWACIALLVCSTVLTLTGHPDGASAYYQELTRWTTYLSLGISLAAAAAFGREHINLSEEAPLSADQRAAARMLGGLALVALAAAVIAIGALWLRLHGGVPMGVEPGRTSHAYFSLPELLQPVLLAALAVAAGAAVAHVVKQPLAAAIVVFILWFMAGPGYWAINGPVLRWFAPLQAQPFSIRVAPAAADPLTLPATWLLEGPTQFQDYWARLLVVPELAACHDLYLVGMTLLTAAVAMPGRYRRPLAIAGVLVGAVAVILQASVTP